MTEHEQLDETPLQAVADYAIELTDRLDNEHPAGYEIGEILIVVEVKSVVTGRWEVQLLSSEERRYVARAILEVAAASTLNDPDPIVDDDD